MTENAPAGTLALMNDEHLRRAFEIVAIPILNEIVDRGFSIMVSGHPDRLDASGKPLIDFSITPSGNMIKRVAGDLAH